MKTKILQDLKLGQKVSKVLRETYETVTRRLRDDKTRNMSGARVAREWLKSVAVVLLICTLGVGNVWADSWTWTASSASNFGTSTSGNVTLNNKTWSVTRSAAKNESGLSSGCVQLGAKDRPQTISLTTSAFSSYKITKVEVECSSYKGYHSVAISVGGTSYLAATATDSWTTVGKKSGTGSSTGNIEIAFTKNSSARALYIKSITVTYTTASCTTLSAPGSPSSTAHATSVDLSWNSVANSSGYLVTFGGTEYNIASGTTSTTISNLKMEKTYTWTVAAKGDGSTYCTAGTPTADQTVTTLDNCSESKVTYTVATASSVSSSDAPAGTSATFSNTYTNNKVQITSGNSQTLTLTGYAGKTIKGLTLDMHANSGSGAGRFSMVIGSTTVASISSATNFNAWYDNDSYGTDWRKVHVTLNSEVTVAANETIVITLTGTTSSIYCQSFALCYASASCTADPTAGAAQIKGSVNCSTTSVPVETTAGANNTDWSPGSNCSWTEKGFVWGASQNPTTSNNKVVVTTGTASSWDGTLAASNSTTPTSLSVGTTYHFRAYGINGKTGATAVYSSDVSFTLRSITLDGSPAGTLTLGTISAQVNSTDVTVAVSGQTISISATPTTQHYSFTSWTITKAGGGEVAPANASSASTTFTMPDDNVTITATFSEDAYKTVTFYNNSTTGITNYTNMKVYVRETPSAPTLTDGTSGDACDATSDKHYGWSRDAWTDKIDTEAHMTGSPGNHTVYQKGAIPAVTAGDPSTISYHAVWATRIGTPSDEWQLVTSTASLDEGDRVVFGHNNTGTIWLLGYQYITPDVEDAQRYYNRKYASNTETVSSSKITLTSSEIATATGDTYKPYVLTVGKSGNYWTFYDAVYGGYLYAAGTTDNSDLEFYNKNLLTYQAVLTDAGKWDLSINSTTGAAAFTSQTTSGTDRNLLKSNGTTATGVFSSYKSTTSGAADPYIFKNLSTTSYSTFLTTCCTQHNINLTNSGSISGAGTFHAEISSSTVTQSCSGNTITLVKDICSGYTVGDWTVTYVDGESQTQTVTVTNDAFTMPDYPVTVSLSTTANTDHFIDRLHNTTNYTGDGYTVSGCDQTVPTLSDATNPPSDETCIATHYKFVGWVPSTCFNSNGTVDTSADGYEIIAGGTENWNASGKDYYAVWAEIK